MNFPPYPLVLIQTFWGSVWWSFVALVYCVKQSHLPTSSVNLPLTFATAYFGAMGKIRGHSRRKARRAREENEAEAASASASRFEPYPATRFAAPDQDEAAFSTAGTALDKLSSHAHEGLDPRRPAYLDDDSFTLASDITRKSSRPARQSQGNEDDEDGSSDGFDAGYGSDDSIHKPSLILNNGKAIYNTKVFLTFEGVTNVPHIEGDALRYLFNPRFATSRNDKDYSVWVKKNLIVAFQGCVLYEDCLTYEALKPFGGQNQRILSRLQGDIGIAVQHARHCSVLYFLLMTYNQARVDMIAKALQGGQLPESPRDPLTVLLIELIDQYIMFKYDKVPLHSTPSTNTALDRVEQRSKTMRDTLADPNEAKKLFTELGCLIPSQEQGLRSTRPWFSEGWVKDNVAGVMNPVANAQASTPPWKDVLPILEPQQKTGATDQS